MLEIKDLGVNVNGKEVLKTVNLEIDDIETHVLLGPNACGKTTLAFAILGHPAYDVTKGSIIFNGQDLQGKGITERAKLGIALAFQNPPAVRGVKLVDTIRLAGNKDPWNFSSKSDEEYATKFIEKVGLDPRSFLTRDINLGFSGGERKRSELAQVFAMKPKLMVLDEPDSGVDIDSVKRVGKEISKAADEFESSILVITHHRHILQYLRPDLAHIMYGGRIIGSGDPELLIPEIEERGYEGYAREIWRSKNECRK